MSETTLIKQVIAQNKSYFKSFKLNYDDGILREHNQEVYEKIIKGLSKGNKVLFEQATGTGKTYLVLKFLRDHSKGKRVLFVSPSNAIKNSFITTFKQVLGEDFDCKLDTCLYQGLKSQQNEQYDIIIFDEAHRLGAKIWGSNAEVLMNNNSNAVILGMTATLDRPDGVDITKYFNGKKPVSRITLVQALERGILPKPDYTLAKVDFEDDSKFIDSCIKDFREKLKVAEDEEREQILEFLDRLKRAKQAIAECDDMPKIFAQELKTEELKQGKFIVFCPAGEDEEETAEAQHRMKTIMKQSAKWFAGIDGVRKIKKYSVYAKLDARKNKKIIETFETDESKALKLLFSINMLNEGLHVNDIDGVIMLRSTGSRIIYLQQLGRALSVGHKHQPKIFDFVANLNYVDVADLQKMVAEVNSTGRDLVNKDGSELNFENLQFKLTIDNLETLQLLDILKQNIFAYNHRNDFNFEDFYNRLVKYKARNGHLNIKTAEEDVDGYPLGQKVLGLRQGNIKSTEEQKQKLTELGLDVTLHDVRFDFKGFYERLVQYKAQYGHLNIKVNEVGADGYPFGQKLTNIKTGLTNGKRGGIKLTQEQRQQLIDLGLDLSRKRSEFVYSFEDFFIRLVAYKARNGHLNIVQSEYDIDGYPLGRKICDLKRGQLKISEDEKQKLIDLGLDLTVRDLSFKFDDFYDRLVAYKKRNGHVNIARREKDIDGYSIGDVISKIKSGAKKITDEQRQKLIDLGVNLGDTLHFDFDGFYSRLVAYKERNKHLNIKSRETDLDGYPLGRKIYNIKQGLLKLTKSQRKMLTDLGLDLTIQTRDFPFVYEEFYSRLVAYKARNGHLKIKQAEKDVDGYPLGMKYKYIKVGDIKITQEQKQQLIDLGLSLEISKKEPKTLKSEDDGLGV